MEGVDGKGGWEACKSPAETMVAGCRSELTRVLNKKPSDGVRMRMM
jgi:hypothetical protein